MDYDQKELQAAGDAARERLRMKPKIIKMFFSKRRQIGYINNADKYFTDYNGNTFDFAGVNDYDQEKIKVGAIFYDHRYRLKEGGSVQTIYQIRFRRY